MPVEPKLIMETLGRVSFPGFSRDVVTLGLIKGVSVDGAVVELRLAIDGAPPSALESLESGIRQALLALEGVDDVRLRKASAAGPPSLKVVGAPPRRRTVAESGAVDAGLLPDVKHVIAVASGKGGVGKSTVAVNLAVALARDGARVGLLDADIYGPSIPLMFGLTGQRPEFDPETRRLQPFERYGVRVMSLGFLMEDSDRAVIWRGPMVMKALEQLLGEVGWGELDVLVVDMPPGTGDAQLTLSQRVQLAGAVIVTTPQDVALTDAIKGINMFRSVDVPLLGLIENMSYFSCPHCGERSEIFGHGGGRDVASRLDIPFLGHVPLDNAVRLSGDQGRPVTDELPESPLAEAFCQIAGQVKRALKLDSVDPQGEPAETGGMLDRFRKIWNDSDSGTSGD